MILTIDLDKIFLRVVQYFYTKIALEYLMFTLNYINEISCISSVKIKFTSDNVFDFCS